MKRKQTNLERDDEVQEQDHVDDSVNIRMLNGEHEKQHRADQYPILAEHAIEPHAYHQTATIKPSKTNSNAHTNRYDFRKQTT